MEAIRRKISECLRVARCRVWDRKRPWQDCDRMFYYAMRCSGVSAVESKTMFYALYKFGPPLEIFQSTRETVKYEGHW